MQAKLKASPPAMNRHIVKALYWPVLMLLALAACSTPKTSSIHDLLETCKSDDGPTDALCGTLEVFEDRNAATGRKIQLKIVVLPALGNDPKPDPLFFLHGSIGVVIHPQQPSTGPVRSPPMLGVLAGTDCRGPCVLHRFATGEADESNSITIFLANQLLY